MRQERDVSVSWTRPELVALREAIEVTPNFEGRNDVRDIVTAALRAPRVRDIQIEFGLAQRFANRVVPVDMPTAMARAKLLTAVRGGTRRDMISAPRRFAAPTASPKRFVAPATSPARTAGGLVPETVASPIAAA